MTHERRVLIAKVIGVLWPVLCVLMTSCTLLLIQAYDSSAAQHVEEPLLWLNGLLSVAGSVAAGMYAARDHERGKAAIVFTVWAGFLAYVVTSFYQLYFLNERQ